MFDVETLFVSRPVGIALCCWFFDIEAQLSRGTIAYASARRRAINLAETWSFI